MNISQFLGLNLTTVQKIHEELQEISVSYKGTAACIPHTDPSDKIS